MIPAGSRWAPGPTLAAPLPVYHDGATARVPCQYHCRVPMLVPQPGKHSPVPYPYPCRYHTLHPTIYPPTTDQVPTHYRPGTHPLPHHLLNHPGTTIRGTNYRSQHATLTLFQVSVLYLAVGFRRGPGFRALGLRESRMGFGNRATRPFS